MSSLLPKVLLIGGLDPSGHAGIIADIRTATALGAFSSGVITTLTNQTKNSFYTSDKVTPHIIKDQLYRQLEEDKFDSVKIGMLYSSDIIKIVSDILDKYRPSNIVLDPVLLSTTGGELLKKGAFRIFKESLLPQVDIVTPNVHEAELLTGIKITSEHDMLEAGKNLINMSSNNVLIKGGHIKNNAVDILWTGGEYFRIEGNFIPESDFRGTGCVLSSAIAVFLAKGFKVRDAVEKAKLFLENARKMPVYEQDNIPLLNLFHLKSNGLKI